MFKKSLTVAAVALTIAVPTTALASTPTHAHVRTYNHLYQEVVTKDGIRAPGRDIVKYGLTSTKLASDSDIVKSIEIMERMVHPDVTVETETITATPTVVPSTSDLTSLEACIIQHESGGNPEAVSPSGTFEGLGQWEESTWIADGGAQYASTPLGASYSEQEQVLANEGVEGQEQQQAQWDGC